MDKKILADINKFMGETGISLGEIVQELNRKGDLGHFEGPNPSQLSFDDGSQMLSSQEFWAAAGMDPTPTFKKYLGNEDKDYNLLDSCAYVETIIEQIASDIIFEIDESSDIMFLYSILSMYNKVYDFYKYDFQIRKKLAKLNVVSDSPLEANRVICPFVIKGMCLVIENYVQRKNTDVQYVENRKSFNEVFDGELLTKSFLFAYLLHLFALLILSKNTRNYSYCSGIAVRPNENIPVDVNAQHPIIYSSPLVFGNQDIFRESITINPLSVIDTTEVGKGFKEETGINLLDAITCLFSIENDLCSKKDPFPNIISLSELRTWLSRRLKKTSVKVDTDKVIDYFTLSRANLTTYINERDTYIYKTGYGKHRYELKPIILLSDNRVVISSAAMERCYQFWSVLPTNGGMPYNDGTDRIQQACTRRNNAIGKDFVSILLALLKEQYPSAQKLLTDIPYSEIFGSREKNYGDYDIICLNADELFLIEAKYFSDSYTGNSIVDDYNKLFGNDNYYQKCRDRFDLFIREPHMMKTFLNVGTSTLRVHFLFVSSKQLDIDAQDNDRIVTFLCKGSFKNYLNRALETPDGTLFRPTHLV